MNSVEEKLWNYIDGTCSLQEQQEIERLIETDELYKRKYQELVNLNLEFSNMELEEPSMAFTYNVMETIRTQEASVPLKAGINKNIIRGITGIFVFIIAALVLYAMFSVDWSSHATDNVVNIKVPELKLPKISPSLKGPLLKGFIFFDVIVGLFFFDAYLRRNRHAQN